MDIIKAESLAKDPEEFPEVPKLQQKENILFTDEEIAALKGDLNKPVDFMQEMAAKLLKYINFRMATEINENQFVSEYTRKWVCTYNDLLDGIQKALYGTKSMSINFHKVSASDVAALMRKNKEETEKVVIEIDEFQDPSS